MGTPLSALSDIACWTASATGLPVETIVRSRTANETSTTTITYAPSNGAAVASPSPSSVPEDGARRCVEMARHRR